MRVLYSIVLLLARVFNAAIIVRVLLSWVPIDRDSPFMANILRVIYAVTEPILGPIRRVIPSLGGLDLSPLIAIVIVQALVSLLARLAY
jgi:YggT family protein